MKRADPGDLLARQPSETPSQKVRQREIEEDTPSLPVTVVHTYTEG